MYQELRIVRADPSHTDGYLRKQIADLELKLELNVWRNPRNTVKIKVRVTLYPYLNASQDDVEIELLLCTHYKWRNRFWWIMFTPNSDEQGCISCDFIEILSQTLFGHMVQHDNGNQIFLFLKGSNIDAKLFVEMTTKFEPITSCEEFFEYFLSAGGPHVRNFPNDHAGRLGCAQLCNQPFNIMYMGCAHCLVHNQYRIQAHLCRSCNAEFQEARHQACCHRA